MVWSFKASHRIHVARMTPRCCMQTTEPYDAECHIKVVVGYCTGMHSIPHAVGLIQHQCTGVNLQHDTWYKIAAYLHCQTTQPCTMVWAFPSSSAIQWFWVPLYVQAWVLVD